MRNALTLFCALALVVGCATEVGGPDPSLAGPGGKADSGWLADTTFEVDAVLRSRVTCVAEGAWAELATSAELQTNLIDMQLKYAKNTTEDNGFRINQLADSVDSVEVTVDGDRVTLEYEATVDMLHALNGELPTLDELEPRVMVVPLPADPVSFYRATTGSCANDEHASSYNYHYYFDPSLPDCDPAELVESELEVVEVFDRPTVYPEYDQLMHDNGDGTVGFRAAIVPARGDRDPASRFDAHQRMIENDLGLAGEVSEDGRYTRYEWVRGGVKITIDLYDPIEESFTRSFQESLSGYELVMYNGHSAYGTQRLLTESESFSDRYQILMLHSCQSYAYYVEQAFRQKATAEDPTGMANTDFVATGRSSYPGDSPITLRALLEGLMNGIEAVHESNPEDATTWLEIVERMNRQVYGIQYGAAGVRDNAWQP